jgi:integrase
MTMSEVLDEWLAKKLEPSSNAASTKEAKAWAVNHLKQHLGRRRASALSYRDVEGALHPLGEAGLSKESLIKVRSVLNQVCSWARQRKYMTDNPVAVAHLPKTSPTRPRESLTVDEARAFREVLRGDELEALWLVMLMSGLRSGETRALRWGDWDPERGTLAVRRNVRREAGASIRMQRSRRPSLGGRSRCPPTFSAHSKSSS